MIRRLRRHAAPGLLAVVLVAQTVLFARPISSAANYDEGVYLAALRALQHGQELGSQVFAAQFPGFYDLLRIIGSVAGDSVRAVRAGLVAVFLLGTVGAWLVGRRFGGSRGGVITAALFVVAPPLDLFGYQVIADTPALALTTLAVGLSCLEGPFAAVGAGAILGLGCSVKLSALTAVPAIVWFLRKRLWYGIGGAAVVVLVVLAWHAGALGSLWMSAVTYHQDARSTPAVIPHAHRQIFDQIPRRTPFFWIALIAFVVWLVQAARRPRRDDLWPLWSWAALTILFLLWHKPLHYNHLVLFPGALAVAAGATLERELPRRTLVWAALAVVLVGAYVQQWHRVSQARTPEPASNVAAAHALARLVPASALVVDDRPIISVLAHRTVVGPLVDLAQLRFETGSLTDAKVIADLKPAKAVVVSRALRTRPRVLAYLRSAFSRRYDAGGVSIWVR